MTKKEVRKYAEQNYLHGKTKQETLEELKKISYRTTVFLEKSIQTIPSLKEVGKLAKQCLENGKSKQETIEELNIKTYRSTADLKEAVEKEEFSVKVKEAVKEAKYESRQKIKIRFTIITSIILAGLTVLLFLYKYNPQIINEKYEELLFWTAIIISGWIWFDKKLLYYRNQLIISLLLCLAYLVAVETVMRHSYIAPIPLASVTGRIIVNKIMDKIRIIDLNAKDKSVDYLEGRITAGIYYCITAAISLIIYLIVKLVF